MLFSVNKILIPILFFLVFIVYANAIPGKFVWDDQTIVVRNDSIKSFGNIPYIFKNEFCKKVNYGGNVYRPIQEFSYMIDYFLWAVEPAGFHITNILFHAACVISFFYLVLGISKLQTVAFISAAIFAAHPLNTEAVTYISARSDPLYLFFLLLSLLFYIDSKDKIGFKFALRYLPAMIFYFISLLSRETAIVFPFILLAYDAFVSKKRRIEWQRILPFFAILLLYAVLRVKFIELDTKKIVFLKPGIVFFTGIKVIAEYLKILIFPFGLHMERWLPLAKGPDQSVVLSALIVAPFTILAFMLRKKETFFWALWFLIFLAPHLNILRLNAMYAEHWIYGAALGIYALFAYLTAAMIRKGGVIKIFSYISVAGILIYLSSLAILRNLDWKDEPSIYLNTLEYTASPKVMSNLGVYYSINKEYDKSIEVFKRALRISPNETWYHNNIAIVYFNKGDTKRAVDHWEKSLGINPNQQEIRDFLAKMQ